jgi:FtsZ-interacting cell division protein ZipA
MFAKIFGGIAAVSAIAALLFWGLWNSEKVKSKELENRLVLSIENTETLKDELKNNSDQMVMLIDLQSKNMDMINDQIAKNDRIDAEKNTALAENRQMRADEAYKALQQPFERGNAASDRVTKLMRGIAGRGPDRDSKNPDSTKTNNPK